MGRVLHASESPECRNSDRDVRGARVRVARGVECIAGGRDRGGRALHTRARERENSDLLRENTWVEDTQREPGLVIREPGQKKGGGGAREREGRK